VFLAEKKKKFRDYLFGSKPESVELNTRGDARYVKPGDSSSEINLKDGRDGVERKNAVYCALVFKEFLKELAAVSQEHALVSL